MTSTATKIHVWVAVLTLGVAACGPTKPPTDVLGVATRNLAAARSMGAERYAPADLRAAEQHLSQANAASARQDYDDATVLAGQSAVDSELAAAATRLAKARESIASLKEQNAELERDAARHPDGGAQP
jgi:hypothetical protein